MEPDRNHVLSILTGILTLAVISVIVHYAPVYPVNLMGSSHSLAKYMGFRHHVRTTGRDEVVVVGASTAEGGVEPVALQES